MELRGSGRSLMSKALLVCCVCLCFIFISILASVSSNAGISEASTDGRSWGSRKSIYEVDRTHRRSLVGPGSYPPQCTRKCGKCTPCRPVHVPVPPRSPTIGADAEYYPEAWRCKCGNRLYMP